MKKPLLMSSLLVLTTFIVNAQAHRDAVPQEGGMDTISILIGLVVGLIIGYVLGSRMNKK